MIIEIAKLPEEPLQLDLQVPWQDLHFAHQEARLQQDVKLKLKATRVEQETIRLEGSCSTTMEFTCSRCLQTYSQPQSLSFDLYYVPHASIASDVEEIELHDQDMELGFYDGIQLDTDVVLAEQLIFAIPMKPLCQSSCKGLCPQCGVNLNARQCNCAPQELHPLQDKLQEMKKYLEAKKK